MTDALLHIKNIAKSFDQRNVLTDCNLTVHREESVAILGRSGSGKSSLLNIIGLLDHPDAGSIHLLNRQINTQNIDERSQIRARDIGFVFQGFHLLDDFTAAENVLMAARCSGNLNEKSYLRSQTLFERMDIAHLMDKNVRVLSGGERQRIALCRALLQKPSLILADEPTGNLDPELGEEVMHLLLEQSKNDNAGLIIVTHDHELSQLCDKRVELRQGILNELVATSA